MFEKYIIHLKNIIFFKIVLYCLLIFALLWLFPIFNDDLRLASERNENATKNLSEATIKLYSIVNAGTEIIEAYKKYEELSDEGSNGGCTVKKDIIDKIYALETQYNLPNKIKIAITYPSIQTKYQSTQIKINNYDVKLQFRTADYRGFADLAKSLYNIMPKNSVILSLDAERKEALDAEMVGSLSPTSLQNLVYGAMHIRLRELSSK
jgi:Uncharacterized protein RP854